MVVWTSLVVNVSKLELSSLSFDCRTRTVGIATTADNVVNEIRKISNTFLYFFLFSKTNESMSDSGSSCDLFDPQLSG